MKEAVEYFPPVRIVLSAVFSMSCTRRGAWDAATRPAIPSPTRSVRLSPSSSGMPTEATSFSVSLSAPDTNTDTRRAFRCCATRRTSESYRSPVSRSPAVALPISLTAARRATVSVSSTLRACRLPTSIRFSWARRRFSRARSTTRYRASISVRGLVIRS